MGKEEKESITIKFEADQKERIIEMQKQEKLKLENLKNEYEAKMQSANTDKVDMEDLDRTREQYERKIEEIEIRAAQEMDELNEKVSKIEIDFNAKLQSVKDEHEKLVEE